MNENLDKEKNNLNNFSQKDFSEVKDKIIDLLFEKISLIELDEILEKLENFPQLKDKKFGKVSYLSPKIIFETFSNGKKEMFFYNLETEKFEENISEKVSEIPEKLEKGNLLISAMIEIFENNEEKEFFGEINKEDILKTDYFDKFGLKLKGKNLREIQLIFRENLAELENMKGTFNKKQQKDFIKQQKKYLEIVMGVGDKFEGGASYLLETQKNFEKISENIVQNQSLTQVFLYLAELHQKIDDNDYQSINVEKSYSMLINYLNQLVFERLKKENASEKDFVTFSKILTGRGNYKNGKFEEKDIDDNLRNPDLASEVLLYIFQKKGGMFEKMGIKSLDKRLKGKTVGEKIQDLKTEISKISNISDENFLLKQFSLGDLLNQKDKKYEDLSFEDQTRLTILDRFITKLKNHIFLKTPDLNIGEVFTEVIKDSQDFLEDKIEKTFSSGNIFDKSFWSGKEAKDFGLTGIYEEAYKLFVSMNGIGLSNFSDTSKIVGKTAGKIGAVIATTIIAAIFTGGTSLVVQGAVAGGVGSMASWAVMPKGYDTKIEASVDLSSDFIVGTVTGAAGGKFTQWGINKFGKIGTDGVKNMSLKTSSFINGVDIAVLGFGAEIARFSTVEKIFSDQEMILNTEENLEKIYKND